jgi:LysM repeat protein
MNATQSSTIRLTRRGRFAVVSVLATLLLVAFLAGRSGTSIASTDAAPTTPYASTTVQPGETLWAVAKRVAPGHDPRAVIDQITALNHLSGGSLQVGQQLLLPRAA